jgi:hypothetical protein
MLVRVLQAEAASQSEIHRRSVPERLEPKGSVCVVEQI